MARATFLSFAAMAAVLLAGCSGEQAAKQEKPTAKKAAGTAPKEVADMPGTPMAERVAVVGFLNKRNGNTRDIELKPGQALRIGDELVIRVRACERTQPWETHPDIGVFVQLLVNERIVTDKTDQWRWAFSGWLFKENPAKNVVQHPIYDVWVKDCKMTFPGEDEPPFAMGLKDAPFEDAPEVTPTAKPAAARTPSNANQSAPSPAPTPRAAVPVAPVAETAAEPEPQTPSVTPDAE